MISQETHVEPTSSPPPSGKRTTHLTTHLTSENYSQGFLVDDEFLGGVSENRAKKGEFLAFVTRHTTGEVLASLSYPTLEAALAALNAIPKEWRFDSTHGCGNGDCGAAGSGKCPAGKCGKLAKQVDPGDGTSASLS